jgi:hypothetical protein
MSLEGDASGQGRASVIASANPYGPIEKCDFVMLGIGNDATVSAWTLAKLGSHRVPIHRSRLPEHHPFVVKNFGLAGVSVLWLF